VNDLSLLVIHHRTPQLLEACLERLARFAVGARVIVVDSGPAEELGALRALGAPILHVPNHSLAGVVNEGLKHARTPLVAHLNADVMVGADTFPKLVRALEPPHVGMVGPLARTPTGRLQDQGLPYRLHYARLERSREGSVPVPWLSGCMQLLKREVVSEVGGMNASLRVYNEDLEWCWRLRRAGWACHLAQAEVLHVGGASTPKDPRFLVEGYRGGFVLSRRYKSAAYRALHRTFVLAQSAAGRRLARSEVEREAFRQIYEMFRRGTFDESPFGETLREINPAFLSAAAR